jgi:hypothetical protein
MGLDILVISKAVRQVVRNVSPGFDLWCVIARAPGKVRKEDSLRKAVGSRICPEIAVQRMVLLDYKNKVLDRYPG